MITIGRPEPMVPEIFFVGGSLGRAGGLFLPNYFYSIIYQNQKTRFVSPGQPDPKAAVNTIAELGGEEPVFCKVGDCLYWHTDPKQVKRHRNDHFWYRHSYLCPNQTDTCPHLGSDFRRREAVNAHCKRFSTCGDFLEANGGIIRRWGTPVTEQELRPYDPNFHKPYEIFDGRTGHSGGRGHY